jgi:polyisoprenoid-binding protein YceI
MSTLIEQQTKVPAGTWQADTVHSSVGFEVSYLGISTFSGEFSGFEATLTDGALAGKAPVSSIEVKDENLKAHLQSPEFFDAERYPELTFSGTATAPGAFEGEITIKGVTKPATLAGTITGPVTDAYGNERIALRLETVVDRTEFGIEWNAPLPGGGFALSNDVKLKADLTLVKAA